jgi:hypothetical protein
MWPRLLIPRDLRPRPRCPPRWEWCRRDISRERPTSTAGLLRKGGQAVAVTVSGSGSWVVDTDQAELGAQAMGAEALAKKRGQGKATVAVARKLAMLWHRLGGTGDSFTPVPVKAIACTSSRKKAGEKRSRFGAGDLVKCLRSRLFAFQSEAPTPTPFCGAWRPRREA